MFPPTFLSQKKYDAYLSCLSNLKPGDKIELTTNYGKVEGLFLHREQTTIAVRGTNGVILAYNLLIGSNAKEVNNIFYAPSPIEKRRYLSPAKKACPKILIGSTNIYWIANSARIEKIVKYNGVQEEKEKKEKAKAEKSLRARSKLTYISGTDEA